eukprot:scaffold44749_cov64-Phaeocystis_antarctica.AAC.2
MRRRRKRVDNRSARSLGGSGGGGERVVSSRARGERIEPVVRGRGRAAEKSHHRAAAPSTAAAAAARPNIAEGQVGPVTLVRAATNRVLHGGVGARSSREAQIAEARALIDQADSVIPAMVVLSARASASRHQRWLERRDRLLRAWLVGAEHAAHRCGQHERGSPHGHGGRREEEDAKFRPTLFSSSQRFVPRS